MKITHHSYLNGKDIKDYKFNSSVHFTEKQKTIEVVIFPETQYASGFCTLTVKTDLEDLVLHFSVDDYIKLVNAINNARHAETI